MEQPVENYGGPSHVLSELQAPIQFKVNEIKLIKQFSEILEPFEEAIDKCQANQIVTASYVIPCVRSLHHAAAIMKPSNMVTTIKSLIEKQLAVLKVWNGFSWLQPWTQDLNLTGAWVEKEKISKTF